MEKESQITQLVYAAKINNDDADELIRQYIPFIRGEAAKFLGHPCTQSDDAFSIAMIAFHEAILGYRRERGAFLPYAARTIRNRLIDESRRQTRYAGTLSLDAATDEGNRVLSEEIPDPRDPYTEASDLEATQQEIAELAEVLSRFGVSFADVADHNPKQERTQKACLAVIRYAMDNPHLLDTLLHTGKLPMAQLVQGSGCDRKTLERHRKYILAMLLIQTNGYEIIRGHLRHVWNKGGASV